jgi:hypothetical protein
VLGSHTAVFACFLGHSNRGYVHNAFVETFRQNFPFVKLTFALIHVSFDFFGVENECRLLGVHPQHEDVAKTSWISLGVFEKGDSFEFQTPAQIRA